MEELMAQAAKAPLLEEKNKQLEDILKRIQIQRQSEQQNLNRLELDLQRQELDLQRHELEKRQLLEEKRQLLERLAGMGASEGSDSAAEAHQAQQSLASVLEHIYIYIYILMYIL
jgi:hypothetical protein